MKLNILIHFKQQKLNELLTQFSQLNGYYIDRSNYFSKHCYSFINDCQDFFNRIGDQKNESQVIWLKAYYDTALKGINPQTFEKVTRNRRVNSWIAAFKVLSELHALLQDEITKVENKLEEVEETLQQVVLSCLQSNLLDNERLNCVRGISDAEEIWGKMTQNEQIKLIERKIRMSVQTQDIYIILDKVLSQIKSTLPS